MRRGRSQLTFGLVLILLGVGFLLNQTVPAFHNFFEAYSKWPMNMFLIGGLVLLFGLLVGQPGLAVPAALIAGIGAIFSYQNKFLSPEAWYVWLLIPAFVGLGVLIQGLLGDNASYNLQRGLKLIAVGVGLFLILSAIYGSLPWLGAYAPALLLILAGLWVLGSGLYRTFRKPSE
ncbi:MAG: hypothetical protein IT310_04200 [Anaerolineales bacterium]|nr:hypothetical protein [Anaerolineales bacterium]